ncbi:MAG: T9SS type A sorting domain-containing protein [Melioribacteraceae bacterium]|nr:T9SS type A sorting domain-containing protein [Melioribacteraceae bacterium]
MRKIAILFPGFILFTLLFSNLVYAQATLSSPVNSISGVSILPKFVFSDESQTNYTIQLTTTSGDYSSPIEINITDGSYSYQTTSDDTDFPLDNATTYYWRVVYINGSTFTSAEHYFKTASQLVLSLATPVADAEVYLYDPLTFYWTIDQSIGDLHYKLDLIESATAPTSWLTTTASYDDLTTIYHSVTGLNGGSKYYWRVVSYYDDGSTSGSYDADDRVVKISSVNAFTTKGGAIEAYPSWPVDGGVVYSALPYFYFYTLEYEPTALYTIHISKTNDADLSDNGDVISIGPSNNLFGVPSVDLDGGESYYWQVETSYGVSTTLSAVVDFNTDAWDAVTAYMPTMSYPIDAVEVYTTAPYLWWWVDGVSTDLRFEVEYREVGGSSLFVDEIDGLTFQLTGLTAGKTYEWRVQSYENGDKIGNASDFPAGFQSFTVVGGGLTNAVASYPVSNPTVYSSDITVYWYNEGSTLGFSDYTVKLYEGSGTPVGGWAAYSSANDVTISNAAETYHTFTGLNFGSTYYWAVSFNSGTYSEGSFTVVGGNTITLVQTTPEDESVVYDDDLTLYWYVNGSPIGITGYKVEYSNTRAFVSGYVSEVKSEYTNATLTGLLPGTTYYWRVSFTYETLATATTWYGPSAEFEFTVMAGAAPVVPQVGSPVNGVLLSQDSPTLSWRLPVNSESALVYDLQVSDNKDFTGAEEYLDVKDPRAKLSNLSGGDYYWRVRSRVKNTKSDNASNYSDWGHFRVSSVTGLGEEESASLPTEFALKQNYPNPFNPTTSIEYRLAESGFVSMKIYDMLGNEIRTLVADNKEAGRYNVVWNGRDNSGIQVTSGTYIYRIVAGKQTSTMKMLLIK